MQKEVCVILDSGAQYGKVIDRRVRELNVESVILPLSTPAKDLKDYKAIIISGGPESVYSPTAPKYDPKIFSLGLPIFGICYGMQLINYVSNGKVIATDRREDGPCNISINPKSKLFTGLSKKQEVLMSHGDSITTESLSSLFTPIAYSKNIIAAIENPKEKLYGVQFHPEVDLTINGFKILRNFLYDIAKFKGNYSVGDREAIAIKYLKKSIGPKQVLVLVSGGVDSTVCAALLAKAINPKKIHAIHVDNGFMRLNESKLVIKSLKKVGIDVKLYDASQEFRNNIGKTISPEIKRQIIGDTFMRVAETAIKNLKLNPKDVILAQGTLRPDLIESASKLASTNANTIKTHHNDTALVRKLRDKDMIVEPLKEFHKDEVRELGLKLGLPKKLVWRQPFPGPGLSIRIIAADKPYITPDFKIINQQLKKFNTADNSVTLLPIQTVGVQGDHRTYSYLAGISGKRNWKKLFKLAREIPKKIHQINRVVYIFGDKITKPITDIITTFLEKETIEKLQIADHVVNQILQKNNLIKKLSQVPVILFPVNFGKKNHHSIAIRTFITNDFMTGVPARPGIEIPTKVLNQMVRDIKKQTPNIARVVYDLTSKPPGTTEWE
jgi:GMP synthase (glutamine-hydrolysing)